MMPSAGLIMVAVVGLHSYQGPIQSQFRHRILQLFDAANKKLYKANLYINSAVLLKSPSTFLHTVRERSRFMVFGHR